MSQLNVSRFVELHDLTAECNIQSSSRDRDSDVVRACSLVCYRFTSTVLEVLVPHGRFHVKVPFPNSRGGLVRASVSKAWQHKKLSTAAAGSGGLNYQFH